jgi:hypothetical protein
MKHLDYGEPTDDLKLARMRLTHQICLPTQSSALLLMKQWVCNRRRIYNGRILLCSSIFFLLFFQTFSFNLPIFFINASNTITAKISMRLSTLSIAAALVGFGQASPVPGVNIANPDLDPSYVVPDSYIVAYKASASKADTSAHENDVQAKLGKGPTATYKIAVFQGYHVETDITGLAKIGAASVVIVTAMLDFDN